MKESIPVVEEETTRDVGLVGLLSCVDIVRKSQECVYLDETKYEVNSQCSGRAPRNVYHVRQYRVYVRREFLERLTFHAARV